MLWVWILGAWALAVAVASRGLPLVVLARVLSVLGLIAVGFIAFSLFTSNPFERLLPGVAAEGNDLNPLLQDPCLIIHPPLLYMGYVGLAVPFAFAVAALMGGRLDAAGLNGHAMDQCGVGLFNARHHAGQLVGLLRTGLGRLVVLGSGGECLVYAMAGRYGPDPQPRRN